MYLSAYGKNKLAEYTISLFSTCTVKLLSRNASNTIIEVSIPTQSVSYSANTNNASVSITGISNTADMPSISSYSGFRIYSGENMMYEALVSPVSIVDGDLISISKTISF